MRLADWMPVYRQISSEFGFSEDEDIVSAHTLAELLMPRATDCVRVMDYLMRGFPNEVYVCGGGECLSNELSSIPSQAFVIAADGATTSLLDSGIKPKLIVTDLDGVIGDQVDANAEGTMVFVHAHGDNVPSLKAYVPLFTGPIIGTCQCEPVTGLYNFGGFTDGDRALCISSELGAKKAHLVGFDFDNPSSKPGKILAVKRRKLHWAEHIIASISGPDFKVVDYRSRT